MTKLYVIESDGGPVKVGVSKDPEKRRKSLEDSGPYRLKLVHVREAGMAQDVERLALELLTAKQMRGEWFNVSASEAIAANSPSSDSFRQHPSRITKKALENFQQITASTDMSRTGTPSRGTSA